MGVVWNVVDDETLLDATLAVANKLAALPPSGLALIKQALDDAMGTSFDEQLDVEASCKGWQALFRIIARRARVHR